MGYGLPADGEPNWGNKIRDSIDYVKGLAESANANSNSAQSNANYAKDRVDSQGQLTASRVVDALNNEQSVKDALSATYAQLSKSAYNVLNTGDPLRDAIADGNPHPLSERFATLAAAQAKFPRATALTEQIDRHAIQYALDHYAHVIAPQGAGEYRIDTTIYTSGADTARGLGNQTFHMLGLATLKPVNGVANTCWFASGNARTSGFVFSPPIATAPACDNLNLRVRIDGNRANVTGGQVAGYYTTHVNNAEHDVEVFNQLGVGALLVGVQETGNPTENVNLKRVWVHGCAGTRGLAVSMQHRKVTYGEIKAWDNDGDGVYVDHSESHVVSIHAWRNAKIGINIHNVSRDVIEGLRSTDNGQHGILISGVTYSNGGDWLATNNGSSDPTTNAYNDLHFDGEIASYGETAYCRFHDITVGTFAPAGAATAGYAMYVEDTLDKDVIIDGLQVVGGGGVLGEVRLPADPGRWAVRQVGGTLNTFNRWLCGGDRRSAIKATDQVVNNSTTLVEIAGLNTFWIGAGETWQLDYTLRVTGADTTADLQLGCAVPSGASGTINNINGITSTATGGTGSVSPNSVALGSTLTYASFASTYDVCVRIIVTAGPTAGSVRPKFAQGVATASDLKILAGSTVVGTRIA